MDNKIIIHISGASGSGKTTLGNKLKDKIGNKVIIKDLDDLRDEFITNFHGNKKWTYIDEDEYQKYIDNYINNQKKPIIFVGLNDNIVYGKNKNLYYNVHSKYNYYIEIDDGIINKQKCMRFLNDITNDKMAMNDLSENNARFIKLFIQSIKRECDIKKTIKMNSKWNKDYKKQGYIFIPSENIYKSVVKLLQSKNKVKTKKNKSTNIKTRKNKK